MVYGVNRVVLASQSRLCWMKAATRASNYTHIGFGSKDTTWWPSDRETRLNQPTFDPMSRTIPLVGVFSKIRLNMVVIPVSLYSRCFMILHRKRSTFSECNDIQKAGSVIVLTLNSVSFADGLHWNGWYLVDGSAVTAVGLLLKEASHKQLIRVSRWQTRLMTMEQLKIVLTQEIHCHCSSSSSLGYNLEAGLGPLPDILLRFPPIHAAQYTIGHS